MKNLFKLALSALVTLILTIPAFAYPDVAANHWAAKQITELTEKGEGEPVVMDVKEGTLTLTLAGDSMVSVRPVF